MLPVHILEQTESAARFPALWSVKTPPQQLYIQGYPDSLPLLDKLPDRGLAIVGTREPTPRSVSCLRKWISELAGQDLVILSGFARGIDAVAHASAIQAGLPTVGVLAAGPDVPYPRQHDQLREQIIKSGGILISELPPGTRPHSGHFLKRNRLIAGWSKATLVVEAGQRSGALNTAWWAREHHRQCLTVPCFPGDVSFAGNQNLIDRDHALPFWGCHSLGAVWLDLSNHENKRRRSEAKAFPPQSEEGQLIAKVERLTAQRGGTPVEYLLDWAISLGWAPQRFFAALQNTLDTGELLDENGLLLKNAP